MGVRSEHTESCLTNCPTSPARVEKLERTMSCPHMPNSVLYMKNHNECATPSRPERKKGTPYPSTVFMKSIEPHPIPHAKLAGLEWLVGARSVPLFSQRGTCRCGGAARSQLCINWGDGVHTLVQCECTFFFRSGRTREARMFDTQLDMCGHGMVRSSFRPKQVKSTSW